LTTFLVVVLDTQNKHAKLTTPTLQLTNSSPAQQKFPDRFDFLLRLGMHL